MISLRKFNGILVVVMILMLLMHAVQSVLYMYGAIPYSPSFKITGRRLFYPLVLHIVISIYLYIKDKRRGVRTYPKLISETRQQMITGIGIIVFAGMHILSYMFFPIDSDFNIWVRIFHFIIDILLFGSICLHLKVSMPRLMVSFGFLESKESYTNFKSKFGSFIMVVLALLVLAEIIRYGVLM